MSLGRTRPGRPLDVGLTPVITVRIHSEPDVVAARQRARQLAALLGFDNLQQTRLATAVSEIARNAYIYGGGGRCDFAIQGQTAPQLLLMRITDNGPGIRDVAEILEGRYRSETGMGVGIVGARRLMDRFEIDSIPGSGTTVSMLKLLPRGNPLVTPASLKGILDELGRETPDTPLLEIQRQNHELLSALEELSNRQDDLLRLNRELEDTNRGVVALYAELDEKADHLRRADEMKSRFLSDMTHEFRTPLNSILALTRLLLDRTDGELSVDQERQVHFIRKGAESLYDLVNDLLDLAKVEAGKTVVHTAEFDVRNLFGALRGMLRPLLVNTSVGLIFEDALDLPTMITDEGKVSQILRNFISNALKFTEAGEVRVSAALDGERVVFSVADTGIGIGEADQERVFQEFAQVDSPLQKKVKGTGLGLPLSRKLAELLGGSVSLKSRVGEGSVFSAAIPIIYPKARATAQQTPEDEEREDHRVPILIVEDHPETRLIYEKYLNGTDYQVFTARTVSEARTRARELCPKAIVLDMLLANEDAWSLLAEWKSSPATQNTPVLVVTTLDDPHKAYGLGADRYAVKPISKEWLTETLEDVLRRERDRARIVVVDDDEIFRYLVKQLFTGMPHQFVEAADGLQGLEAVRDIRPDLIFLDLVMPGMSGMDLLERLRDEGVARQTPVLVTTSKVLKDADRRRIVDLGAAIVRKEQFASGEAAGTIRSILADRGMERLLLSDAPEARPV